VFYSVTVQGGILDITIDVTNATMVVTDLFGNAGEVFVLKTPCADGELVSFKPAVFPANTSEVKYTAVTGFVCASPLLVIVEPNGEAPFSITPSVTSTTADFTPGQPPVTFTFATGHGETSQALSFNVGGNTTAGESIIVQARGQSNSDGNHPFKLTLLPANTCEEFIAECPGDSEPCFLNVPHESEGYRGKWYLQVTSGEGGADAVWLNISLGLDNCATVFTTSSDFCEDQSVETTEIFGGFFGVQTLDFIPELTFNVFQALPGVTAGGSCLPPLKKFVCQSAYRSCDAAGWVPLDSGLCAECEAFVNGCSSTGLCFGLTPCTVLCSVEGTATASGTVTATGTGTGHTSAAASLRSFVDLLHCAAEPAGHTTRTFCFFLCSL